MISIEIMSQQRQHSSFGAYDHSMLHIQSWAERYLHYGVHPSDISADKLVFVELCCMTANLSRKVCEVTVKDRNRVIAVDKERHGVMVHGDHVRFMRADITCATEMRRLEAELTDLKKRGFLIFAHMSPPCNNYSQQRNFKARTPPDYVAAGRIVHSGWTFLSRHAVMWTVENPYGGGRFRDYWPNIARPDCTVHGSYCQLADCNVQKHTLFVCNDPYFKAQWYFDFRRCPGNGMCSKALAGGGNHASLHTVDGKGAHFSQDLCSRLTTAYSRYLKEHFIPMIRQKMRDAISSAR